LKNTTNSGTAEAKTISSPTLIMKDLWYITSSVTHCKGLFSTRFCPMAYRYNHK
jgi:hypothetical protein